MSAIKMTSIGELEQRGEAALQTGPFGTQLKASDYTPEGTPVINVRNIGFGSLREDHLEYLPEGKAAKLWQHHLKTGDIVFGRKGAVERHALIDKHSNGWIQGSDCMRLRITSSTVCEKYLSYYLRTAAHQDWMQALCSFGATMSSLNQDILRRLTFPSPPLETQQKIAAILSAYDDLIANNQRRITLLERMAEDIYREWFVRLRFPGHEQAKIEKGVPQGWSLTPSNDAFDVLGGGTPNTETSTYWNGSIPFFTPRDASENFYALTTEKSISEKGLHACSSQLFPKNTIFITARGTVGKLALAGCEMAMNQSCYALQPKHTKGVYFHYLAIRESIAYLKGISKSGVFDNIVMDTFKNVPLLLPQPNLRDGFNQLVNPFFVQAASLLETNRRLVATRDALLPRLISGKLAVDALVIRFPPGMTSLQETQ